MHFPDNLLYTQDHEWVRIEDGIGTVGITDFAQNELGDIVYLDIETLDQEIERNGFFGTVEAVKTVSDLFCPLEGTVIEVNEKIQDEPQLANSDPYGDGWLIKLRISEGASESDLMTSEEYKKMIGVDAV